MNLDWNVVLVELLEKGNNMMGIIGWLFTAIVGMYLFFVMSFVTFMEGIGFSTGKIFIVFGWLVTFGVLFFTYRYCPFTISLDK